MELTHEYDDWSPHPSSRHQAANQQRERWRWLLKGRLQGASVALLAFVFWKVALVVGLTLFVLRAVFWSGRRYWLRRHHHTHASTHTPSHHHQHLHSHPHPGSYATSPSTQTAAASPEADPPEDTLSELEVFDRRLRAASHNKSEA